MLGAPTYHPALHVCNRSIIIFIHIAFTPFYHHLEDREARVQEESWRLYSPRPNAVGDRPHLGEGPAVNHLQDTQI